MLEVLIGLFKLGLLLVTAVAGYLGIVSDFKDKSGRLTQNGRKAVFAVLVCGGVGLVLQGLETSRDIQGNEASKRFARETIAAQNELLQSAGLNLDRQTDVLNNTDSIQAQMRSTLSAQSILLRQLSRTTDLSERTVRGQALLADKSQQLDSSLTANLTQTSELLREQHDLFELSQRAFSPLHPPQVMYDVTFDLDSTTVTRLLPLLQRVVNAKAQRYVAQFSGDHPDSIRVRHFYDRETGVEIIGYGIASKTPSNVFAIRLRSRSSKAFLMDPSLRDLVIDIEQAAEICLSDPGFVVEFWRDSTGVAGKLVGSRRGLPPDLSFTSNVSNDVADDALYAVTFDLSGQRLHLSCGSQDVELHFDNRKVASTLDLVGSVLAVSPIARGGCNGLKNMQLDFFRLKIPGRRWVSLRRQDFARLEDSDGEAAYFVRTLTDIDVNPRW